MPRLADFRERFRQRAGAWYEEYFFAPASPVGLALCRLGFYGYLLQHVLRTDFAAWSQVPAALWKPILLLKWLPGPIASPELLLTCQILLAAALATCLLGLRMRESSLAALVLGVAFFGLPQCFGKVDHDQTLVVLVLGIFTAARSADALSLDALVRRWRGQESPAPSGEYRWPVALVQALMCVIFFAAGVAKLRASGPAWIFSDHLQNLVVRNFYTGHEPPTRIGLWLAQHPWLCQMLAAGALLAEIAAPLALLRRRFRWLLIPGLFGMQVGIYLVMGVNFKHYLAGYLFWIPWDALLARAGFIGRPQAILRENVAPTVRGFETHAQRDERQAA